MIEGIHGRTDKKERRISELEDKKEPRGMEKAYRNFAKHGKSKYFSYWGSKRTQEYQRGRKHIKAIVTENMPNLKIQLSSYREKV